MSKFQRSWVLFKRSFQVIRENRKLLLFPLVTSVFIILIALFFIVPFALSNTGHAFFDPTHWKTLGHQMGHQDAANHHFQVSPLGYAVIAGIYLLSMFLSTFFNVAFYNEIFNALNGRPVSIRGGLRFARSRLKAIFIWSLFAGLVGLIIKALEERVGLIGRWVLKFIGIAWSVAAVFVIPVIIREENHTNPVLFLKTSALLLKKTWGESLIGYAGISFGGGLIISGLFVIILPCLLVSYLLGNGWMILAGFLAWLTLAIVFSYILGVASQVFRCALFI